MKIFVKTLKGSTFDIEVKPEDTVSDVKKNIEVAQGAAVYPAAQQMLIHQGKVLKDNSTLDESKVAENSFIVIMLTKNKSSSVEASSASAAPTAKPPPTSAPAPAVPQSPVSSSEPPVPTASAPPAVVATAAPTVAAAAAPTLASTATPTVASTAAPTVASTAAPTVASTAAPTVASTAAPTVASTAAPTVASTAAPTVASTAAPISSVTAVQGSDIYGHAASNLVAGNNLEGAIQQILDMGGGTWDRDTVIRALRAAYNNPERAVEYLYSGIPEQPEVAPVVPVPLSGQAANPPAQSQQPTQPAPVPSSGPNANPLDLFPRGLPSMGSGAAGAGTLDFLRNSHQFQALRTMVQANPQILQPMLQELVKQNPNLMRLIQEHQADFLRLINEPVEGGEGNVSEQLASSMPQAVTVTPEEREAIERLEAMGFDRAIVLEVFFACNKNEELAANYLLDHINDFED